MNRLLRTIVAAFCLCAATAQASAQSTLPKDEEEYWRLNFRGWDVLVFRCAFDNKAEILEQFCHDVSSRFDFIVAPLDLKYINCAKCDAFERSFRTKQAGYEHPLLVEASFSSSGSGGSIGGEIQLSVGADLSDLICLELPERCGAGLQRYGDVELWYASGAYEGFVDHTMVPTIGTSMESFFRKFLAIYIKARK